MDSLVAGDLEIELKDEAAGAAGEAAGAAAGDVAALCCVWKGRSNERQPGKLLAPYFEALIHEAGARRLPLEMHFEELEHFNSSTITALIGLIQRARRDGVKLVLVYDQGLKWQRLSFDALRVFDKRDELFVLRAAGA